MSTILRTYFAFIFFFATIASTCDAAECVKGTYTSLQYSFVAEHTPTNLPRLDQSIGKTRFVLQSEPQGEALLTSEFEGWWSCFGYNAKTHVYVIGGVFQRGAWLPLGSIEYLAEDGSFKPSAFDRQDYIALSAVTSPAGRYIVFIGGGERSDDLYVLDTERDVIKKLGRAPSPPPNAEASDTCWNDPFEWGSCWVDGYREMDAGIIRFTSETELEVSYGKDGPTQRAKKRRVQRYRL